jgi:hypothetical protein
MSQLLFGRSNQRRQDGRGMQCAWKRLGMRTEFYREILKERRPLWRPRPTWDDSIKIFKCVMTPMNFQAFTYTDLFCFIVTNERTPICLNITVLFLLMLFIFGWWSVVNIFNGIWIILSRSERISPQNWNLDVHIEQLTKNCAVEL